MTSISSRQRVLQNSYYFSSTRSSCLYCDCVSPKIHCKPSSLFIIFFSETSLEIRPLDCFDARWLKRRGIMQGSGHGRKSRGDAGDQSPRICNEGSGDADANCSLRILPCFKISSTRLPALQALQCSKKLTNPMTLTENSLLLKRTSSTSTKSPLQTKIQHFYDEDTGKKYRSECTKTRHFKRENNNFLRRGLKCSGCRVFTCNPQIE